MGIFLADGLYNYNINIFNTLTKMNLPIYDITLDDFSQGIMATSLVDYPAIESDFIHFNKDEATFRFSNEEKREVLGAVLVPDKLIYRRDGFGNEYYVKFTAEVIQQLNAKMHEDGFNKVFTIGHELEAGNTVKFLESWIKETEEDKSNAFGINEPIGSLFMKVKIESEMLWENIKENKLNGFSIELDASIIETKLNKNMDLSRILKNEIVVGEETLLFNTLAEGEVVASDNKEWSGTFTHEGSEVVVEDGNVISVTEVPPVEAEAVTEEVVAVEVAAEEVVEEVVVEEVVAEELAEEEVTEEVAEPIVEEVAAPIEVPVDTTVFDSIESLNAKVDALTSMITNHFASMQPAETTTEVEELSANIEEIKLELKQQTAEAEIMSEAVTDEVVASEFSVENYRAVSDWGK